VSDNDSEPTNYPLEPMVTYMINLGISEGFDKVQKVDMLHQGSP
jgi:hypothetical protein